MLTFVIVASILALLSSVGTLIFSVRIHSFLAGLERKVAVDLHIEKKPELLRVIKEIADRIDGKAAPNATSKS